jgi:hypothetical protein
VNRSRPQVLVSSLGLKSQPLLFFYNGFSVFPSILLFLSLKSEHIDYVRWVVLVRFTAFHWLLGVKKRFGDFVIWHSVFVWSVIKYAALLLTETNVIEQSCILCFYIYEQTNSHSKHQNVQLVDVLR